MLLAATLAAGCRCAGDLTSPLVQDFESDADVTKWPRDAAGEVVRSTEWKFDGAASLRIDPGLLGTVRALRRRDLRGFEILRVRVRNTSPRLAQLGFELVDSHDDMHDRHRASFGVPPGDSTLDIDLTGDLWRGEENRPFRGRTKTPIDLSAIERIGFENRGDAPIFIDALTLVADPLPAPEAAFAFDFGGKGSRVMAHTTGIFDDTTYGPATSSAGAPGRWGFVSGKPTSLKNPMTYPTPLLGDGLAWGDAVFQVDLPGGSYTGWIAFERGGFWQTDDEAAGYEEASLFANGAAVHHHTFQAMGPHFHFQDFEVTSVAQALGEVVWPAHAVHRFSFEAKAGPNTFSLAVKGARGSPLRVAGLILAPSTPEGRAFVDAHEDRQRRAMERAYPESDVARRPESPSPLEGPLVVEPRPVGEIAHPRDLPDMASAGAPPPSAAPRDTPSPTLVSADVHAVAGHLAYAQLALYAPRDIDVSVRAAPASATTKVAVRRVLRGVYGAKRPYAGGAAWVETHHFRPLFPEQTLHVGPDLGRSVVVELDVPADAPNGLAAVLVHFERGAEVVASATLTVRVTALSLPPLPIPVGLFMNALPYRAGPGDEERWWSFQEELLRAQGEAGLNTPTGGSDLRYSISGEGDAMTFTGDSALRYLALAKKHGMGRAVVCYAGFLPSLKYKRPDAARFTAAWKAFEEAHGLPPHYVYSYDEPSTDDEIAAVSAYLGPFHEAGLRTIGFFAKPGDDPRYRPVLDRTFAPAVSGHTVDLLRRFLAEKRRVFLYNRGTSRLSMGADLASMIDLGAHGRLEWIGLYSQGFAFHDLDGREPSFGAFVAHGILGPLPTPRWLSLREGLIDARIILALRERFGAREVASAGFPAEYPADPSKWPDGRLESARAEALRRLVGAPHTE